MKFLTAIFLFLATISNAQNIKYIDENMQAIDSITLSRKCNQRIYKCLKYDTDTLIINKILYRFNFGVLDQNDYEKILEKLSEESKNVIAPNDYIILRYFDSLKSFSKLNKTHQNHPTKRQKIYFDSTKTRYYYQLPHKFNRKIYEKNQNKFIKFRNKCIKKYETKFSSRVFHVFDDDSNVSNEYQNFEWIEDNGLFKSVFFNVIFNYWSVIIKPDGEYFLIGGHISDKNIYKLLENKDWTNFKHQWEETSNKFQINGTGIFEDESHKEHKKHCF